VFYATVTTHRLFSTILADNFRGSAWPICSRCVEVCTLNAVYSRSVVVNPDESFLMRQFLYRKAIYKQVKRLQAASSILDSKRTCRKHRMAEENWTKFVLDWRHLERNFIVTCSANWRVCIIATKCNQITALASMQEKRGLRSLRHKLWSKTNLWTGTLWSVDAGELCSRFVVSVSTWSRGRLLQRMLC
jgi:hypothetical protein